MSHHEPTGFEDFDSGSGDKPYQEAANKPETLDEFGNERLPSWPFEDDLNGVDFSKLKEDFEDLGDEMDDDFDFDFDLDDDFEGDIEPAFDDLYGDNFRPAKEWNSLIDQAARAAFVGGREASGLPGIRSNEAAVELMQTLASAAALSKSRGAAERLAAALVPLSLWSVSANQRTLWPVVPALVQGTAEAAKVLHKHAATRPLLAALPAILNATIEQLVSAVKRGKPVTRRLAAKTLAQQTAAQLGKQKRGLVRSARSTRRPSENGDWWDGNDHGF